MLPSILAHDITEGLSNFIVTGFETPTPYFSGIFQRFVAQPGNLYKGPYLSLGLPFLKDTVRQECFSAFEIGFTPYIHQRQAFDRLRSDQTPHSTIIATGTGSGKTECFLYPLLDHCLRNPGPGIKAIIIYPMNALATDQAKRFAHVIHNTPAMKGKIRVGLFVGESEHSPHKTMSDSSVITDKDALRQSPPDILLTNYKMLDYLLIRPRDRSLWSQNHADTLRYLVVDELHTFDGAQGTDLACLLRRLKARLDTPKDHLVCVGTSATLGSGDEKVALARYASQVFQSNFEEASIIGERRKSMAEFLGRALIRYQFMPPDHLEALIDPDRYHRIDDYLSAQYRLFFPDEGEARPDDAEWCGNLGSQLKEHLFFHNLLRLLERQPKPLNELADEIARTLPRAQAGLGWSLLNSLCALIACARDPDDNGQPLVQLRLQLWVRELRRMVTRVSADREDIRLAFADDVKHANGELYLPMVQCNECHGTAWVATRPDSQSKIQTDLRTIYSSFFGRSPEARLLYPLSDDAPPLAKGFKRQLCAACGQVQPEGEQCSACGDNALVAVFEPDNVRQTRTGGVNRLVFDANCPICGAKDNLVIFGSRAASLLSVAIHHSYASPYNDDKKLIAFSDSVQDAAHKAGFFAARTWQNNVRMAISQALKGQMNLTDFWKYLPAYWSDRSLNPGAFAPLEYVSQFIAPNMLWYRDYAAMQESGEIPRGSDLLASIANRLEWEVLAEFGYRSRIGRSLERTATAALGFHLEAIQRAADKARQVLAEEVGFLRDLEQGEVESFILGFLLHLKSRGAIYHPFMDNYIETGGTYFLLTRQTYLPGFGPGAPLPRMLISADRHSVFDTLELARGKSWYQIWCEKTLGRDRLLEDGFTRSVYRPVIDALIGEGVFKTLESKGETVWTINPDALYLSDDVAELATPDRRSQLTLPVAMKEHVLGMPSIETFDQGVYGEQATAHWLRQFYRHGQIHRVIAEEHTGLLDSESRDRIEKTFMASTNREPWYPNLLSATPTLEMGIDIGDLSSVMLCSVPPAQANYLQRIGRAGRRDGNAFNLTAAAGRPHDLYFYSDPMQIMAGRVEPPGVFLNASAVIERQMTAFCLDSWVSGGVDASAIPDRLKSVIDNVEKGDLRSFPYNYIKFVKTNAEDLRERFLDLFEGELSDRTIEYIGRFLLGDPQKNVGLEQRLINKLFELVKERKGLKKRIEALKRSLEKLQSGPQDEATLAEIAQIQNERGGLQAILREINARQTLNFMTDEGLIPNYAFPEEGVTLRSVIYRRRVDPQEGEGQFENIVYEYERAGASAISELAPDNRFYAGGRKVRIEQVDLGLSEVEEWRFCRSCSHAENLSIGDLYAQCPRCGDAMWVDEGQRSQMVRLRQVMANTSDKESRIGDDSDDREPAFYTRQMLADFRLEDVELAFSIADEAVPFGFEFIRKSAFREMNFGEYGEGPDSNVIAGREAWRPGFKLCRGCGMVQDKRKKEQKHAYTCKVKDKADEDNIIDCLYLYREFTSEAIRVLLPTSTTIGADRLVNSFVAAIQLGLKLKFGGKVDHLRMMVYEEPIAESEAKKRFLMLYDSVPGGTGYLHELMRSTDNLLDIFQQARDTMVSCSCNEDPEKDGCYQCLYAYRNSYGMETTSRDAAVTLLGEIIEAADKFESVKTISDIKVNPVLESELEARFIEAIKRCEIPGQKVQIQAEVVNGKPGYFLSVGAHCYTIEPQVNTSQVDGVHYASCPDFIIRSSRESHGFKPVAVFMDGYQYHKDKVTEDTMKRLALVQSGRYFQWSMNWQDVNAQFATTTNQAINYFTEETFPEMSTLQAKLMTNLGVASLSKIHMRNSFEQLMLFLSDPDAESWRHIAFTRCLGWFDRAHMQDAVVVDRFKNLFEESSSTGLGQIAGDLLENPAVGGMGWVVDQGIVRALCAIPLRAISEMDTRAMVVNASIDMAKKGADAEFKPVWAGFFRVLNMLQFLPAVQFGTMDGIQSGFYEPIEFKFGKTVLAQPTAEQDPVMEQLLAMVHESVRDSLRGLLDEGLLLPEIGYELQNEEGEIVADGELAWVQSQLVVLVAGQERYCKDFEDNGWIVLSAGKEGGWVDAVRATLTETINA